MIFNATYLDSEFVVDIAMDLTLSFPEVDPEYELAYAAMGGKATPVHEFTQAWDERPIAILSSKLALPWDVLTLSLLNYVEHVFPMYEMVCQGESYEILTRFVRSSLNQARDVLPLRGTSGYGEFLKAAQQYVHDLSKIGYAISHHGVPYPESSPLNEAGANMAWAAVSVLQRMRHHGDTSAFILGASKVRSVVREVATYRLRDEVTSSFDPRIHSLYDQERTWQVQRALDVAQAFRDVEAETPEGQRVDLGRVMELAGDTP